MNGEAPDELEIARECGANFGQCEGDRRMGGDLEEVGGAKVIVALLVLGVDGCWVDDDLAGDTSVGVDVGSAFRRLEGSRRPDEPGGSGAKAPRRSFRVELPRAGEAGQVGVGLRGHRPAFTPRVSTSRAIWAAAT